jgi:hypothetical protein
MTRAICCAAAPQLALAGSAAQSVANRVMQAACGIAFSFLPVFALKSGRRTPHFRWDDKR